MLTLRKGACRGKYPAPSLERWTLTAAKGRAEGGVSLRGEASGLSGSLQGRHERAHRDSKREDATFHCWLCRRNKGPLPALPQHGKEVPHEGRGAGHRGSWRWLPAPDSPCPWSLPAVLVPGRGLANVLRTLPMFHDKDHARACSLPEDTLVLP